MNCSSTNLNFRRLAILFFMGAAISLSGCKKGIISGSLSNEKANSFNFQSGTKTSTMLDNNGYLVLENDSTTETTLADFKSGSFDYSESTLPGFTNTSNGEITLGKVQRYTTNSTLALSTGYAGYAIKTGDFIIVWVEESGLTIINTMGTNDISDDEIVGTYSDTSIPAIGSTYVDDFIYEDTTGLIYISNDSGAYVIDTNGTLDDMLDDTLAAHYSTTSTPTLAVASPLWNDVVNLKYDRDSGYLYLGSRAGLSVIDTKFTATAADDTLVVRYTTSTTPPILNDTVHYVVLDKTRNLLYIGNVWDGYVIINTQGTDTIADDATVDTNPIYYNFNIYLVEQLNLLIVNDSFIDTKGTITTADDVHFTNTNSETTDSWDQIYDENSGYLYVIGSKGLWVYNLNGTANPADDVLIKNYGLNTNPSIGSDYIYTISKFGNMLLMGTDSGLVVLNLEDNYQDTAIFISGPSEISTTFHQFLSWDQTVTADQSVSIQYRTGTSDAVYRNDFDDNLTTEFSSDPFAWGNSFATAVESGGTLKLSDPNPWSTLSDNSDAYFWIDTGKPAQFYPVGSIVTARLRINSSTRTQQESYENMFTDDWSFDEVTSGFIPNNEWVILRMNVIYLDFSLIGFNISFETGTWDPADTVELDWLQIETPDSMGEWSAWSTPCTNNLSCEIDPADLVGQTWMQYRVNLETTDNTTTPVVSSVSWNDSYQASGIYESLTSSFNGPTFLKSFEADVDLVAGSTIDFEYSTNGGISWISMSSSQAFAEGTLISSFRWRATLATVDPNLSPRILNARVVTSK